MTGRVDCDACSTPIPFLETLRGPADVESEYPFVKKAGQRLFRRAHATVLALLQVRSYPNDGHPA